MRTTTTIAALLAAVAMFTSACSANIDPEPTATASQKVTACGFQEMTTAICDRTATLGSCTELRAEGMDTSEAREICESSDGQYRKNAECPRDGKLLGVCPAEEQPGQLRLHYYYAGDIFADSTVPTFACANLNNGSWCSAQ